MNNVVLASYFNYMNDPQRGVLWDTDYSDLLLLIGTVIQFNLEIKIFHNCFVSTPKIKNCEWIRINPDISYVPTVFRHFVYREYLKSHRFDKIFMVDSTDVMMLKNPFPFVEPSFLYVGEEKNKLVSNKWMKKEQGVNLKNFNDYFITIENYSDSPLLNAGIIGGDYDMVRQFLNFVTLYHSQHSQGLTTSTDMAIFNYTILKHFYRNVVHGDTVTTEFKKYTYNDKSWWKHK